MARIHTPSRRDCYPRRRRLRSKMYSPPLSISINSLPVELILTIFSMATKEPAWPPSEVSDPSVLLRLSHVCKRWREISLDHGHLWASIISVDYNKLCGELIRRAKAVPLVIHSNNNKRTQDFTSAIWQQAFSHLHNWRSLAMSLSISADHQPLLAALTQPATKLETFQIHRVHVQNPSEEVPQSKNFILPQNMFAGNTPQLRTFSVMNVLLSPSFDFSLWRNLTTLKMQIFPEIGTRNAILKLSAPRWLEILAEMPQIEVLQIVWIDEPEDIGSILCTPDIRLDRLRRLDLQAIWESRWEILLDIFSKLLVPKTCEISICIDASEADDQVTESSFHKLMTGVNKNIEHWSAIDSLQLNLERIDRQRFGFDLSEDYDGSETRPIFRFSCQHKSKRGFGAPSTRFSRMLQCLKSMAACSGFTRLGLNLPKLQSYDKDAFHDFMLSMTNVTSASIILFNPVIVDILVSGIGFNHYSQSFTKGERLATVILPNLTSLACTVLPKDWPFVHAYASWRKMRGELPECFVLKARKVFLGGDFMDERWP